MKDGKNESNDRETIDTEICNDRKRKWKRRKAKQNAIMRKGEENKGGGKLVQFNRRNG